MRLRSHSIYIVIALALLALPAWCFPPYAKWISKHSKTQVDCSYCHLNSQGPTGSGPGQLGSLTEEQKTKLDTAESPILNSFGQSIIKRLGYQSVIDDVGDPQKLADALKSSDLDGDGISDGVEMEHGTLANDPESAPWELIWKVRLQRNCGFLLTVLISGCLTVIGLIGLSKRLR